MAKSQKGDGKQVLLMIIITVITQFLTIYKSSIIAANFGTCVEMDAYHFANNLSSFFLTFISSGITTVIIPSYVKKIDRKAIDTFLTVVIGIVIILLLGIYLFREPIVIMLTPGRGDTFNAYVCGLMQLTMWIQILPAILGVTTAYYQCENHFVFPKVVLMLSNLGITVVLMLWKTFDIYEYLYVLLGGALFQTVVDVTVAIYIGFRFRISFDIHNSEYISMLKVFLPTVFSTGVYKINTMVDSLISSNLGEGQITILSYSNTIVSMINTLIISNLTVYVYPKIVEKMKLGQKECQEALWGYIVPFHAVICLVIIGFVGAGREFIGILYERGEFTKQAADCVYLCMCIYVVGQQNNIVRDLLYRYFYTNKNTKATFKNGIMTSAINIVVSIILAFFCGVYGIVLGTVISGVCSLIVISLRLKKQYGFLVDVKKYIFEMTKTEGALIVSTLGVLFIKSKLTEVNLILSFFLFGSISVIAFAIGLFIFRSKLIDYYKKI